MNILDLLSADGNDYPACDNQQSAENNGRGRFFREGEPGNCLGDKEKNRYIDAQIAMVAH
jgi:hypothetical protein